MGLVVFIFVVLSSCHASASGGLAWGSTCRRGWSFFWHGSLPWLAVVLIYMAAFLFFIYLACAGGWGRSGSIRFRSLRRSPRWRPGIRSVLGGIWKQESYDVLQVVVLYFLVVTSIFADHRW